LLHFRHEELITPDQAARVHELAQRVLEEIGIEVCHEGALESLRAKGFSLRGRRVLFQRAVLDEFVDEMRSWISSHPQPGEVSEDKALTLTVSPYCQYVQVIETGEVVPYTIERLIEMCKLMDSLAEERVEGTPPGTPPEIHPHLQPLAQYRIGALYARQGARPVDPTSARTVNHLLDMAEVMQRPIRSLPVYMVSPLRFGGESLDVVLACHGRLEEIAVGSMPAAGATAPVHPYGALVVSAAELMGGMVILHVLTGKPVTFSTGIFSFDMRTAGMVFGTPETLLFHMLAGDFDRFYGWPERFPDNICVMAKLPDAQAASERAAALAVGALLGARNFAWAGTLSLDEIFSPEQLLVDCEIRDWVQHAVRGLCLGEKAVDDWLAEIKTGVERGFMTLDSTLEYYKRYAWYPRRFRHNQIAGWLAAGQPHLSSQLREEARRRIAAHNFELDAVRSRELAKIYLAAEEVANQ
jgi:trimethylamine--corrinoid protein Co-methyltransferase